MISRQNVENTYTTFPWFLFWTENLNLCHIKATYILISQHEILYVKQAQISVFMDHIHKDRSYFWCTYILMEASISLISAVSIA